LTIAVASSGRVAKLVAHPERRVSPGVTLVDSGQLAYEDVVDRAGVHVDRGHL